MGCKHCGSDFRVTNLSNISEGCCMQCGNDWPMTEQIDTAAELAALRATVAEQAAQLDAAREVISATLADSLKPQHLQQCDVIIPAMRDWLKAHPAPVNNSAKSSNAQ